MRKSGDQSTTRGENGRDGWNAPEPATLPRPTYAPAMMALAIALVALGIATTYIISAVGFALFGLALAGWIGELVHEQRKERRAAGD